jgi:hypothetical protein
MAMSLNPVEERVAVGGGEQGNCALALTTPKSCMVKRSHCENQAGGPS